MRPIWPLTGRAEELAFIADASASVDGPRGVVLAGAAGVGKTRLAREALTFARQRGMTTRWVAATDSARRVPFGAFATLLGSVAAEPTQVIRNAVDEFRSADGGAGVIVGVDDAHLLDAASAMLVHQLVLRNIATVVITVRTGEPAPDALTAVWKDEQLDRLELQPLSANETGELLEAVLGGPVDSTSARRIWALTRGNALFLRQLVDGEVRSGRLHQHELWRWTGDPVISLELTEMVEAQMGLLRRPVRDVVDLLALGEPLDVEVISALTDPAAVEECEAYGLVSVERDRRRLQMRLSHPLYGEVRRSRVGPIRARRLRGQIAQALADSSERGAVDTMRYAVLALDSDLEPDPQLLVAAARSASNLVDLPLAERLARAAVSAGGGFEPQLILAHALSFQSRGGEAEEVLAQLADQVSTDLGRSVVVAVSRVANLFWVVRDPTEAAAVLTDAEEIVNDEKGRLVLAAMRSAVDAGEGRASEAVRTASLTLASVDLPAQAVMVATYGLVAALGVLGRSDEIGAAAARGYTEASGSIEVAFLQFGLAFMHVGGLRLAGRLHEAEAVARSRRQISSDMPDPAELCGIALTAQACLAQGKVGMSLLGLQEARAGLGPIDNQGFGFVCLLNLTEAFAIAGDPVAARRACDQLEAERHPAFAYLEPEVLLARAWVAAAEGSTSNAAAVAVDAATQARRLGQPAHEVMALQTAARFGDRTVADRLAQLAAMVDGPRAPVAATYAAALAANDGDALIRASMRYEDMGDLLAAADAAAQAAVAFTDQSRAGTAASAAARALGLVKNCGGAHTPAVEASARPLPLTEREREIVTLAARGLSNRAIAERLVVSVRTVEGHVYNASAKLGMTNRSEFAAVLAGRSPMSSRIG